MDPKDEMEKDYSGLSPDEMAALNDNEDAKDIQALLDDEGGEEVDADPETTDPDEEEADEEPSDEPDEDEEPSLAEKAADVADKAADIASKASADVRQQMVIPDASADLAALKQKFDDGEIDLTDYLDRRDAIKEAVTTAKITATLEAQTRERDWVSENDRFFEENPDYSAAKSKLRYAAMQQAINDVAADPANANLSDRELLRKGKEMVDKEFGLVKEQPEKKATKPRLVSDRAALPPSLKDIPSSGKAPTGGGEYADMEGLSGMDYEAAVARIPKDRRDTWARG